MMYLVKMKTYSINLLIKSSLFLKDFYFNKSISLQLLVFNNIQIVIRKYYLTSFQMIYKDNS